MKHPTPAEKSFLNLAYNKFYDIHEQFFWKKWKKYDPYTRFTKLKQIFWIYSELLNYPPIIWTLDVMEKQRPPNEKMIASDYFTVIRHLLMHFPCFDSREEVWFSESLINRERKWKINTFFRKYEGHEPIKFRIWEAKLKKMTYLDIWFPKVYTSDKKIFLKDLITEKDWTKFCIALMKKVLDSQIESIKS